MKATIYLTHIVLLVSIGLAVTGLFAAWGWRTFSVSTSASPVIRAISFPVRPTKYVSVSDDDISVVASGSLSRFWTGIANAYPYVQWPRRASSQVWADWIGRNRMQYRPKQGGGRLEIRGRRSIVPVPAIATQEIYFQGCSQANIANDDLVSLMVGLFNQSLYNQLSRLEILSINALFSVLTQDEHCDGCVGDDHEDTYPRGNKIAALIAGIGFIVSSLLGLYCLKSIQDGPHLWRWVGGLIGSIGGFVYCLVVFLNALIKGGN
jgi:hypothetical protein